MPRAEDLVKSMSAQREIAFLVTQGLGQSAGLRPESHETMGHQPEGPSWNEGATGSNQEVLPSGRMNRLAECRYHSLEAEVASHPGTAAASGSSGFPSPFREPGPGPVSASVPRWQDRKESGVQFLRKRRRNSGIVPPVPDHSEEPVSLHWAFKPGSTPTACAWLLWKTWVFCVDALIRAGCVTSRCSSGRSRSRCPGRPKCTSRVGTGRNLGFDP